MKNTGFFYCCHAEDKVSIFFIILIFLLQLYLGLYAKVIAPFAGLLVLVSLIYFQCRSGSKWLKFFRSYIHIPLYGIIFAAFQTTVHKINPADYDWLLLKLDAAIFSFDITVWFQDFISRGLTELLTLSYFSYYILPSLTFLLLFIQKMQTNAYANARWYILSIVIGWYAAFVFYAALPAAGPDIAFPEHYSTALTGLSPITSTYLSNLGEYLRESKIRNTFPSMHFAIILMTNFFAFRFRRKYFFFCTLPLGTLLGIATLYLRQHYLIDLAGSLPMALFSIYIARKLIQSKYKTRTPADGKSS